MRLDVPTLVAGVQEEEKDRTDEGFHFQADDGMYKELEIAQKKVI